MGRQKVTGPTQVSISGTDFFQVKNNFFGEYMVENDLGKN